MKITTITVLKSGDVTLKARDTVKNRNVETIMENLRTQQGDLIIAGDEMKKYERYALQRKLQKQGAQVTVHNATHNTTKKPVLVIHRMSAAEWKEYQGAPAIVPAKRAAK